MGALSPPHLENKILMEKAQNDIINWGGSLEIGKMGYKDEMKVQLDITTDGKNVQSYSKQEGIKKVLISLCMIGGCCKTIFGPLFITPATS